MNKKFICFFGIGNVGLNFFKVISNNYKNSHIFIIFVRKNLYYKKKILEKRKFKIYFLKNYFYFLKNKFTKLIIEVTGDIKLTNKIFKICLKKKKIITANKKFICINFKSIKSSLNKYVFIEPSILGGIPIVDSLSNHFCNFNIKKIEGIFNGTTNFIIYKMIKDNISYKKSLNIAINRGYSEKKPYLDICGADSYYKIYIAIGLLGKNFYVNKKFINGIGNIKLFHIKKLKRINKFFSLKGKVIFLKNFFSIEIFPYLEKKYIKEQYNYIKIFTKKDYFLFKGKGAGGKITSYSLLKEFLNKKNINIKKKKNIIYNLDIIRNKILIIYKYILNKKIFNLLDLFKIKFYFNKNFILIRSFLSNNRIINIKKKLFRYISVYFIFKTNYDLFIDNK
ncbi:hypothetical protein ACWNYQ_00515 [Candidatus Vidania fulgoroideorum]